MRVAARLSLALGVLAGVLAGWRILATGMAGLAVADDPARALAWSSSNPDALQAIARRQFMEGDAAGAIATARTVLEREPLHGDALVLLAEASEAAGDAPAARRLHELALQRAPRNVRNRTWMIGTLLAEGRSAQAIQQAGLLLTMRPRQAAPLLQVLVAHAEDEDFAAALAAALAAKPAWRPAMLGALLSRGSHAAVTRVHTALLHDGGLADEETAAWLDRLVRANLWGEAYGRWIATLRLPAGTAVPLLYNGDFELPPRGIGFDWRLGRVPGVHVERVAAPGARGQALQIGFLGRRVTEVGVQQTLLLAPGDYRFHMRAKARGLRSERGLEWRIACVADGKSLLQTRRLLGDFDWKVVEGDFSVPQEGCPVQRLSLQNPGAGGAARIVSGTIWFDDVGIEPLLRTDAPETAAPVVQPASGSDPGPLRG